MLILKLVVISCTKINFILKERSLGNMEDLNVSEKNSTYLEQLCSLTVKCRSSYFQCMEKCKWDKANTQQFFL